MARCDGLTVEDVVESFSKMLAGVRIEWFCSGVGIEGRVCGNAESSYGGEWR